MATAAIGPAIDLAGKLLDSLLKDKGFGTTTSTFNPKDEDHFKLVVTGSQPKGDNTLVQAFYSDYWWGDLIFEQTGGTFTHDSVTVTVHIYHHAGKNRPHTGDTLTGDTAVLKLTLDAGAVSQTKKAGTQFLASAPLSPATEVVEHPGIPHADKYVATLDGSVLAGDFAYTCDLLSWTFTLEGWHLEVAPKHVKLAMGPVHSGSVAVTISLGEYVGEVAAIRLAIQYDPHLTLAASDIVAAAGCRAEATFDLGAPGYANLLLTAENGIRGPSTIATLNFRIPEGPKAEYYPIRCNVVEARGPSGLLDIGGDSLDLSLKVPQTVPLVDAVHPPSNA